MKDKDRLAAEHLCAMRGIDPMQPVQNVPVRGGAIVSGRQWHVALAEINAFRQVQAAIAYADSNASVPRRVGARWVDGGYRNNGHCPFMQGSLSGACCTLPHGHEGPHVPPPPRRRA